MISLLSIVGLGFWLGMRHAADPDHMIAVATIVSRQPGLGRAALTGMAWGVGHTLTIFVVGTAIIGFNLTVPARVGLGMELLVGLMLVALGLSAAVRGVRWMVRDAVAATSSAHVHSHAHSHGDYVHTHPHAHSPDVHPHRPDETPLTRLDRLFGGRRAYEWLRPLIVGVVHGLAGSAAVALLVLAAIQDPGWAVSYLLVFGVGTVAGMMMVTVSLASTFRYAEKRQSWLASRLATAAGLLSLIFGAVIVYRIVFVDGLLATSPQWIPR